MRKVYNSSPKIRVNGLFIGDDRKMISCGETITVEVVWGRARVKRNLRNLAARVSNHL